MHERKRNPDESTLESRFPALEFWVEYENDYVERRELIHVIMRARKGSPSDAPRSRMTYDLRYRPPWGIVEDVSRRLRASGY